jgi:hypothetical protein
VVRLDGLTEGISEPLSIVIRMSTQKIVESQGGSFRLFLSGRHDEEAHDDLNLTSPGVKFVTQIARVAQPDDLCRMTYAQPDDLHQMIYYVLQKEHFYNQTLPAQLVGRIPLDSGLILSMIVFDASDFDGVE